MGYFLRAQKSEFSWRKGSDCQIKWMLRETKMQALWIDNQILGPSMWFLACDLGNTIPKMFFPVGKSFKHSISVVRTTSPPCPEWEETHNFWTLLTLLPRLSFYLTIALSNPEGKTRQTAPFKK